MNKTQFNRSEHKRIKAGLPSQVDQFLMMPSVLIIFLSGDNNDNERNILMIRNSPRHIIVTKLALVGVSREESLDL